MKIRVHVLIESETGNTDAAENIVCLEREDLRLENLGLALAEAKSISLVFSNPWLTDKSRNIRSRSLLLSVEGTAPQSAPAHYVSYAVW